LTLKSNSSDGLRYVAGIYLDTGERSRGPYGMDFPGFGLQDAQSDSDDQTAALFGQFIYPLTEQLDLTLGGRYQRIKKDIDLDFLINNAVVYSFQGEKTWSTFLPKAALNYTINDNWSTYASYSKGYMPGGFNFFATSGTLDDNSIGQLRNWIQGTNRENELCRRLVLHGYRRHPCVPLKRPDVPH